MIENTHRIAMRNAHSFVVCGKSQYATRRIEKWPSFISTPACSMLTAAGAAAWPTGDQECMGHNGAIDANPKKSRIQIALRIHGENCCSCPCSSIKLKVCSPVPTYVNRIPSRATTAPADRNNVSFIAAYSLLLEAKLKMKPTESRLAVSFISR